MPLSEHEQQLLDQLEKQLRSEDPRFAQNITQPRPVGPGSLSAKRFVGGVLALIVGAAAAVAAIYFLPAPWNAIGGVLGFAVMVAGGYWAIAGNDKSSGADVPKSGSAEPGPAGADKSAGFMNRMEERWDKRRRGE
jgi:hypothetical protein